MSSFRSAPDYRSAPVRAAILLGALLLGISGASAAAGYHVESGKIRDPAGRPMQLRGINHFGFNSDILQPQYLWTMGWKEQIAQIRALGFNAVRLPFVPDTLYVTTPVDQLSFVEPTLNRDLLGKTPLQVLDLWMAEADRQQLYVLLDFHSISRRSAYPTWFVSDPADYALVYNNRAYTRDHWIRDLVFVASRYANLSRFIGIDLYNEPQGAVRWDDGDPQQQDRNYWWKPAAEAAAAAILEANPRLLIFVEGINGNFDGIENSSIPMNWGEDLQPQAYAPLQIPSHKLVLAPHTYGPDVFMKSSFSASSFPENLAQQWEILFGQLHPRHAVVIGEWGGKFGSGSGGAIDVQWQKALVSYLLAKQMTDSFYWTYTPNSGDTGGILDDHLRVRQDKMALLQQLWSGHRPAPAGGGLLDLWMLAGCLLFCCFRLRLARQHSERDHGGASLYFCGDFPPTYC